MSMQDFHSNQNVPVALPAAVVEKIAILCATDIYTEPLTKEQLSRLFGVGIRKVSVLLPHLEAEEVAGRYRIPLRKMPPRYLLELGLL